MRIKNFFRGEGKTKGLVTGVSFRGGETILKLDDRREIFLRDVISFQNSKG